MHPEQQPETRPEAALIDGPQVWIGSLSDYNAGILYGDWLDAAREPEEVRADIDRLLTASPTAAREGLPAEEYGIFDYQGFRPLRLGQYDPIDHVCRLALGIAEHGPAYAAWASLGDRPADELTSDHFEEAFLGHFASLTEYVEQFVDDMGYEALLDQALPAGIRPYVKVDVAGLAHDLELSGDVAAVEDGDGGSWLFQGAF